ncbi:paraquat-inducible protein A [Suttonella ornithocola]|uniref:Inner membrane protein yebS n=1 Tax=Suttonella ornithocola TaxID=279832 RepID=A0A380MZ69_9GAMM|nr:paraquat-inducible protein A [Suttonella ornithocola]SUO97855.1 Inner membrane protein yebS [Suttonella ornithocola]
MITAKEAHKKNCLACGSVISASAEYCSHCHAHLYSRKPQSISRTWAYLLTSMILFFPANLLPITYTSYLGSLPQADTIMSSIMLLWHHGSYGIAIIIFTASIFTPFLKIAILTYLLTHQHPQHPPKLQTKLYKFIHFIGRWSMIDVFVVALLGALIHGKLAQINPGMGIFAFTGVVIFTMFATETFDIRLLWDNYNDHARTKN